MHVFINRDNHKGLTNVLVENMDYKKVIHFLESFKLDVLCSGPIPPNPSELLGSFRMRDFLAKAKMDYDMIILDSPPVGLVTDAAVLSTVADGTILVYAAGQTKIEDIKGAKNLLDKVNATIIGVVMNKVIINKRKYKHAYYNENTKKIKRKQRKAESDE
jgi:capsular exopolysaccharide synthesis family protein